MGKTVASVADIMHKVAAAAEAARPKVLDLCAKVATAVQISTVECDALFPGVNAGVEDYVESAQKIASLVEEGMKALKSGDTVVTGDELMTIVTALIDGGLGGKAASDILAAAQLVGSIVSEQRVPTEQEVVAGAQLVATAVDNFLGDDGGGRLLARLSLQD